MKEDEFIPVIGLEIHVQLRTNSKMFCGCSASWFGRKPNTLCCPVCLGLPGALPAPNRRAIEWCVMLGLSLNCHIPSFSKFDRKNYFYPDLPKGYQISQYDKPLCISGWLDIQSQIGNGKSDKDTADGGKTMTSTTARWRNEKRIRIRRVHLEEDTGKLLHATVNGEECTLIDFNRSGVPLVEIVTEPDIRSSNEAKIFLKKLHRIIRYLGISDADMEKGSMRIEPNVSVLRRVRPFRHLAGGRMDSWQVEESRLPTYKIEIKNINSFAFAKKAIDYEIARQIKLLKEGKTPKQETRGWDEKQGIAYSQRGKEEAHDYRYFPEPDIPPICLKKYQIANIKKQIGELPDDKITRFTKEYSLSEYNANILTDKRETADYFENSIKYLVSSIKYRNIKPKIIADWIVNKRVNIAKTSAEELVKIIAKKQKKPTISDEKLEEIIKKVIAQNPKAVKDYKSGKEQAIMYLVGQVQRIVKGKGEGSLIRKKLQRYL